jgi:hypothetical protein
VQQRNPHLLEDALNRVVEQQAVAVRRAELLKTPPPKKAVLLQHVQQPHLLEDAVYRVVEQQAVAV